MTQRVVLVTGAAGGIGRATVTLFRHEGWYVIGFDRVEASDADRHVRADHAVTDEIEAAFEQLDDIPRIDAVVNNAAVHLPNDVLHATPEEWDLTMATNLRSAYLVTRLAHRVMCDHGGAIVNVASIHAVATSRGVAAYATSKGGLLALTRASALDLATDGIRVNAVLPGAIDTPMLLAGTLPDDRVASVAGLAERTPLGRIGRPDEIARAILFLADPMWSSFITGHALVADGGALARLGSE